MTSPTRPTGVLLVEVWPSGLAGKIYVTVRNVGDVLLRPTEKVAVLQYALEIAQREVEQDNEV